MQTGVKAARVWTPDEVLGSLAPRDQATCPRLLTIGQWPHKAGDHWAERVGVLELTARPQVLLDAWVYRDSLPELSARLGGGHEGGWDVMLATRWRWAWGGAPFTVWSRRGWTVRVDGPARATVRRLWSGAHELEVRQVYAEVSRRWLAHRVGLRTTAADTVWVSRSTEIGPLIDFTYDGLNLLADASWASTLGKALAAALEVPFEANDPTLR